MHYDVGVSDIWYSPIPGVLRYQSIYGYQSLQYWSYFDVRVPDITPDVSFLAGARQLGTRVTHTSAVVEGSGMAKVRFNVRVLLRGRGCCRRGRLGLLGWLDRCRVPSRP